MTDIIVPDDSGPIYRETVMGRWPVEPWNTWSLVFFLFIILYWSWKLRHNWREHKVVFSSVIMISIGLVGGFVYHSTRSHLFWLLLDWVPIVINANLVAVYLWYIITRRWSFAIGATYVPLLCSLPLYLGGRFNSVIPMSLGYATLVLSVTAPFIQYSRLVKHKNVWMIYAAALSIVAALLLRTFDKAPVMEMFPMGTHFLWHTLGALTCHFLMMYVYFTPPSKCLVNARSTSSAQA